MLLFETYGGWSEPGGRLFRRMQDKVRKANQAAVRERSELVDVDVARAAVTAPLALSVAVHIRTLEPPTISRPRRGTWNLGNLNLHNFTAPPWNLEPRNLEPRNAEPESDYGFTCHGKC